MQVMRALLLAACDSRRNIAQMSERKEWVKYKCSECGKEWEIQPSRYLIRLKTAKYGKLFCSRRCGSHHAAARKHDAFLREVELHLK